jgi:hypothetical protein
MSLLASCSPGSSPELTGPFSPILFGPLRGVVIIPRVIPHRMRGFAGRGGVAAQWS